MNTPSSISSALRKGYKVTETIPSGNQTTVFLRQRFKGSNHGRAQEEIYFRIGAKALQALKNKGEIPE